MRTVYDAWRGHERYEYMDERDKMIVDEYEADREQEKADRYDEERLIAEIWEDEYED